MERELYNLKTKILRSKHISDQLKGELTNDVFKIEKLVNKTNDIHNVSQKRELLITTLITTIDELLPKDHFIRLSNSYRKLK